MSLTGRIAGVPSQVWHEEVLAPQFAYEVEHLLPWYVAIEKVFLLEYARMGLVDADEAAALAARWAQVTPASITADPRANMSDIAFALERYVADGPVRPFGAWHVDRSRNDLQACAQRMFARDQLIAAAQALVGCGRRATRRRAGPGRRPRSAQGRTRCRTCWPAGRR